MPRMAQAWGRKTTGRVRVRKGWYGTLVLQVQVENEDDFAARSEPYKWIDARECDLSQLDRDIETLAQEGTIPQFDPRKER